MIETSILNKCQLADFQKIFTKKGYAYFTKGAYNLNIIGVRHDGKNVTNHFDDALVLIYTTNQGVQIKKVFKCTTLPGKKAMNHPTNFKGTAILKEGQYRGAFRLGYHKGKYRALVQYKSLPVYRDNNKDNIFDLNPMYIDNGVFGINIHKAGNSVNGSTLVDGWSYGCQVLASNTDFTSLINACVKSAKIYGDKFTYTLINEKDLSI